MQKKHVLLCRNRWKRETETKGNADCVPLGIPELDGPVVVQYLAHNLAKQSYKKVSAESGN